MVRSRALLCDTLPDRPACLASTSEPDMFLGVALVCPAFLNLLEQNSMRNCVLVFSAGNDSDCWCVAWFRVLAGVTKSLFFAPGNRGSPFFCSLNVTSEIAPTYVFLGTILWCSTPCFDLWVALSSAFLLHPSERVDLHGSDSTLSSRETSTIGVPGLRNERRDQECAQTWTRRDACHERVRMTHGM